MTAAFAIALRSLKAIPWQLWAVLALIALGWLYGNHRYSEGRADEKAAWEAVVAESERRAREAERDAEAAYAKSEQVRVIETNTIREVARKAEDANPEAARRDCGPVTSAVLETLRTSGAQHPEGQSQPEVAR